MLSHRPRLETEAEDVGAGGYRYVLIGSYGERHGRAFHADVGWELPQGFAGPLIGGGEASVGLAVEDQASGGGEDAGPGFGAGRAGLRDFPRDFAKGL
jgi:hypothetical protein